MRPRRWLLTRLVMALTALSWGANPGWAAADKDQMPQMTPQQMMEKQVKPEQRKAAAANRKKAGLTHRARPPRGRRSARRRLPPRPARACWPLPSRQRPADRPTISAPTRTGRTARCRAGRSLRSRSCPEAAGTPLPRSPSRTSTASARAATATATVDTFGAITQSWLPAGDLYGPGRHDHATPDRHWTAIGNGDHRAARPANRGHAEVHGPASEPGDRRHRISSRIPGADYYEIELSEYTNWQFHTDLARHQPAGLPADEQRHERLQRLEHYRLRNRRRPLHCRGQHGGSAGNVQLPGADIVAAKGPAHADQVHQLPAHGRWRQPLHPGRTRRSWARGRAPMDGDTTVPAEPRHAPPPRRLHAVDQRRDAAPVDRRPPEKREHLHEGRQQQHVPDMADPGPATR